MERTPITEEILQDYEKSSQWMRTNIFLSEKRIQNKIGIGFIGTGGGAKIFDYLFREKSSRAILFAQMPYHQEAIYMENISYFSDFENANLILVDNKFYKENYDEKNVVCDITPISAASEFIAEILCKSCHRKVTHIIENDYQFDTGIAISLTVDFGSENDKPARFFIQTCTTSNPCKQRTFGYLFREKHSREKMNNTIVVQLLNILSNEINDPEMDEIYDSVGIDEYPKRSSELVREENQKYYDRLYRFDYQRI
jgi:hypothetical protein